MNSLKDKLKEEIQRLTFYFLFFALFFSAFTLYGLIILKEYHVIALYKFSYAILEALILSKLIILGEHFRLGERYNDRPLIYPTLFKTLLFSVFIVFMTFIEEIVLGWLHGRRSIVSIEHVFDQDLYTILAKTLVIGFVLLLFFAFTETSRVLGRNKLYDLFFIRK